MNFQIIFLSAWKPHWRVQQSSRYLIQVQVQQASEVACFQYAMSVDFLRKSSGAETLLCKKLAWERTPSVVSLFISKILTVKPATLDSVSRFVKISDETVKPGFQILKSPQLDRVPSLCTQLLGTSVRKGQADKYSYSEIVLDLF